MVYDWKPGSRFNLDAQKVGEALVCISERNGGVLTATDVVQSASRKNSPLHEAFEWDDTEAARQYRLHQARVLVASVTVKVDGVEDQQICRAFANVRLMDSRVYSPSILVMSDGHLRRQTLQKALNELSAFKRKYAMLTEFAGLFEKIKELELGLEDSEKDAA